MKAKIMLGFLLMVLGTAFSVAALDGGPEPLCRLGKPCQAGKKLLDGPISICRPNVPCPKGTKGFDGDPIPVCRPNVPCPVQK